MRFYATPKQVHRHLSESELDEKSDECQLCGSTTRSQVLPIQTEPLITLLRCMNCLGVSVSRFPKASVIETYYKHSLPDLETHQSFGTPSIRIANSIVKSHVRSSANIGELRVLDFGGGDGSIGLAIFSTLGASGNLTIVDFHHPKVVDSPAGINVTHVKDLGEVTGVDFHIVIASAVLEHLRNPREYFLGLVEMLAVGGILYVRTPFVVPLMKLTSRFGGELDFTFPAHLHDLGQPFWENTSHWLPDSSTIETLSSRPSPVEANFGTHPARYILAALMKFPWHIFGKHYQLVGGWECLFTKHKPRSIVA